MIQIDIKSNGVRLGTINASEEEAQKMAMIMGKECHEWQSNADVKVAMLCSILEESGKVNKKENMELEFSHKSE